MVKPILSENLNTRDGYYEGPESDVFVSRKHFDENQGSTNDRPNQTTEKNVLKDSYRTKIDAQYGKELDISSAQTNLTFHHVEQPAHH